MALLEENATIISLPGLEIADPSIESKPNHPTTFGQSSVGGTANYKCDARSTGGGNVAAAVRVVQKAVREVLVQNALVKSGDGDRHPS